MAKVFEVAFKIGADMAASFAKTMQGASSALGELNKSMSQISSQQAANQRVLELRNGVASAAKEFYAARSRVQELGRAIKATANPSKEMRYEYEQAQMAVRKAHERLEQQRNTLRQVSEAAKATGKSITQLVAEQNKLAQAGAKVSKVQEALQKNLAAQQANKQKRSELRGQLFDAVALGATLAAPVKKAMEWEQRLAEFNKVASKTPKEVQKISTAAQKMAVATGVAREEIMGAYIAAAQAGFDENEWGKYAEVASKMGVAFDISGEAAGEMLKAWRSSMGLTMDEAEKLAAAVNHIANNMNATAADVGEVLQRQGAVLRSAGLSQSQSAALAAAMLSGGAAPEVAATAAKNFVLALTKGSAATNKQRSALQILGFGDPVRLAKAMQKDAEKVVLMVLQRLQGLDAHTQTSIMTQLFGSESIGGIAPLIANLDNLRNAFGLVRDESQYIASLEDEFATMGSTTANQLNKARESIKMITTTIGATLLPTVNQLLAQFAPLALKFAQFAQDNQGVVKALILTAAALIATKVAAVAGGYAWTFLRGAYLSVQGAVLGLNAAYTMLTTALNAQKRAQAIATVSTKAMAAAQRLLNTAMLANPFGVVVAAIMGLVVAGALLYKYWGVVVAFLKGAWSGLVQGLEPLKASLAPLEPLFNAIKGAIGWVIDGVSSLIGWFKQTESSARSLAVAGENGVKFGQIMAKGIGLLTLPVRTLIESLSWIIKAVSNIPSAASQAFESVKGVVSSFSLFNSGKKLLETLAAGIKSAMSAPVEAVKEALAKVREFLPFSDAKVGPLSELTYSGMQVMQTLTQGIRAAAAKPAEAVEAGLATVAGGLSGFANRAASAVGIGGGPTITLNQTVNVTGGGPGVYEQARRGAADGARDLIRDLQRALQREERLSYG